MTPPDATIVIPCYNHGEHVGEAVESALRQREARIRVVVVNDGSNDGTTPDACEALAGDRVRVIHQENRGLPAARNRGAAGADTEYLVFLDADDVIEEAFVSRLARAIDAEREAGRDRGVSHAYCRERLTGQGGGVWRVPEWDPLLLLITNLHPVTALVRRERFEAVGGFDESMRDGYEDWDLWIRFMAQGWRGVRVPEPLFVWRRHSEDTMVMESRERHEELYSGLMQKHRALFDARRHELLLRMNAMLSEFRVNWLDESGEPISRIFHRQQVNRLRRRLREAQGSGPARKKAGSLRSRLRSILRMPPPGAAE